MGKVKLYDLSQPFGHNVPLWPYFEDVKIERVHYHAKSGVLSQKITTVRLAVPRAVVAIVSRSLVFIVSFLFHLFHRIVVARPRADDRTVAHE